MPNILVLLCKKTKGKNMGLLVFIVNYVIIVLVRPT